MPDGDVNTIRGPIHYQYATIIAKSAFAASDGENGLKLRGDKKFREPIPPLLPPAACRTCSGRADIGDMDGNAVKRCWT